MFIDTSAIIALLQREPEAPRIAAQLDGAEVAITSPLVILEASMVLSRLAKLAPMVAEEQVRSALAIAGITVIPIDDRTASLAVAAFARFGKGQGNPAKLDMSDCLTYACAKQHRVPLLYVGDDFASTDLA